MYSTIIVRVREGLSVDTYNLKMRLAIVNHRKWAIFPKIFFQLDHQLIFLLTQTCEYHTDIGGQCLDRFDSYRANQKELVNDIQLFTSI